MGVFGFFKAWGKGVKDYAKSPVGLLQTQLIITFFVIIGFFAGAFQMKLLGMNAVGFVLFALGLLQIIGFFGLYKQYNVALRHERMLRKIVR